MAYEPTESLSVTWKARNAGWRKISPERRAIVTDAPERYRDLTISDLPATEAGSFVRRWCQRWGAFPQSTLPLREGEKDYRGKGLLLTGPPGTGKTRMAVIAAQYVSDLGWSTKFVRAQDFYALALRVVRTKDEEERERIESAFDCYAAGWAGWRLVVMDDLGREYQTDSGWSENLVENLVRARFTDGAPSIVTTNLSPERITKRYGSAMGDYIHEAFWIVTVDGPSKRREADA